MADSYRCLHCQVSTTVENRRILQQGHRVFCYCKAILVELSVAESGINSLLTDKFMCRKCWRKYDEHVKERELFVSSMGKLAGDLDLIAHIHAGQKRLACTSLDLTTPPTTVKCPKKSFISHHDPKAKSNSTTVVSINKSCVSIEYISVSSCEAYKL